MNEYTYKATLTYAAEKSSEASRFTEAKTISKEHGYEYSSAHGFHHFIKAGKWIHIYPKDNKIEVSVESAQDLSSTVEDALKLAKTFSLKHLCLDPTFTGVSAQKISEFTERYQHAYEIYFPTSDEAKTLLSDFKEITSTGGGYAINAKGLDAWRERKKQEQHNLKVAKLMEDWVDTDGAGVVIAPVPTSSEDENKPLGLTTILK